MIKFCQDRDIIITAYCPLGRPIPAEKKPAFLYDAKLAEIGKKYNKTVAQVVFRYLVSGFYWFSRAVDKQCEYGFFVLDAQLLLI